MGRKGRQERLSRYTAHHGGSTATHSQDYLLLASRLHHLSAEDAKQSISGNTSLYAFAGIPILVAALQAFVVEYEFIMYSPNPRGTPRDVNRPDFIAHYDIVGELLDDLNDLLEVRNEIIHPAHAPCGAKDNWPRYLLRIKEKGVLNSTGDPESDCSMLSQIASHRLFTWATDVTRALYQRVIESDSDRAFGFLPFLSSFDGTVNLSSAFHNAP